MPGKRGHNPNKRKNPSRKHHNSSRSRRSTPNKEPEHVFFYLMPKEIYELKKNSPFPLNNLLLSVSKYEFGILKSTRSGNNLKKVLQYTSEVITYDVKEKIIQDLSAYLERIKKISSAYKGVHFIAELEQPLAIGLGRVSVRETSIALHHVTGFPYIPSFSIKGLTRSYIIETYYDGNEDQAMLDDGIKIIFGYSTDQKKKRSQKQEETNNVVLEHAGLIIFFDALPMIDSLKTGLDIMTPHYQDYYTGKSYPTDNQKVIPIKFPVVKKGKFQFSLAINPYTDFLWRYYYDQKEINTKLEKFPLDLNEETPKKILDIVTSYLKEALNEEGIGAKTALSYGTFKK